MNPVIVEDGDSPVVLGMPHGGTQVPEDILGNLNETGKALADTDWHIDRLYEGLLPGASRVRATFHRYVIDANRDPGGASLYPGQNTTGLCPLTDFDGKPIWHEGEEPNTAEIERRRAAFHAPYHAALSTEIDKAIKRHGCAVLYDCHSIRSEIPFLFEGVLPDLNIGTYGGSTCAPAIAQHALETCRKSPYRTVLNGRFRGGWTTRHYGRPENRVHAIQMETAQSTYMDERPPWAFRDDLAERLRPFLDTLLRGIEHHALRGDLIHD